MFSIVEYRITFLPEITISAIIPPSLHANQMKTACSAHKTPMPHHHLTDGNRSNDITMPVDDFKSVY
jgi:hypothetical protein